jgi:hypothetical protein
LNVRKREIEKALTNLKKAIVVGGEIYTKYAKEDEIFKAIQNDPRFIEILSEGSIESYF